MKRSWTTILLITALVGLLVLLGGLQFRWLSQINVSENEKAHKRLQEQADRFAMDFNREIQGAYFNFQFDAEKWQAQDWGAFNERYDFWRDKTAYPDLITEFYLFEEKGNAAPLRYDRATRTFVPFEATADLAELRSKFSDDKAFRPIYEDALTLVLPIYVPQATVGRQVIRIRTPNVETPMTERKKYGYLAIKLDPATIENKILPDLTAKYFGEGDFRTAVADRHGQAVYQTINGSTSDAAAPLFDLSPENFVFFANKDLMNTVSGERHANVFLTSKVESHTMNRTVPDGKDGTVKIEVQQDSKPRTSIFTTTARNGGDGAAAGAWTLQVQHVYGSLDGFMASTLRRNLAIGFGLLFLLAAAVAAIIISAQRAKTAAQRQVDFVSSVSHEFRTPLAVIYSAGENLADGVLRDGEQVTRYGDLIKGEGRKLSRMVEQILDFAGANSGRKKYSFASVDVSEVVDEAIAECRPLIEDRNIDVETSVSDALPPINGDRTALCQAIQNLIVNSVKYSNGNAWLRLTAENGGGRIKIAVEDHGIGISKGDLRQIFEPFYRSKEVVDAQIPGNGLGLSLVKQIAEAHGGGVTAQSVPGKGSKFTIELPQIAI